MKALPKVLVFSPIITDAVSSWRAAGPLSKLEAQKKIEVRYIQGDTLSWLDAVWADVVMMHRPFLPHHVPMMHILKELNKSIWSDFDDHLFDVHPSNTVYFNYSRPDVQASIRQCLQLSDVVSVSVEYLHEVYAPFLRKCVVVPNAWDDRLIRPIEKTTSSNLITWRGSDSHKNDLLSYLPNIASAIRKTPNYNWKFIGYHAWEIPHSLGMQSFGGRVQWVPGQHFWSFYRNFSFLNPDLHIVPLELNNFNKSKSNISWIEAAMSGAPSIAPNWEMWNKPGCITYASASEFEQLIIEYSKDKDKLKTLRKDAVDYITTELPLDVINKKRMDIIESLMP